MIKKLKVLLATLSVTVLFTSCLKEDGPEVKNWTQTFNVNGVSFKMITTKGGTFTMGSNEEDAFIYEKPAHQVKVSSFAIGETEVTQELWQAVMGNNPSFCNGIKNNHDFGTNMQRPVENVSREDCLEFIDKLNQITGKTFRLPTEAEWEYAARGGNFSKNYNYSGSNDIEQVAWYGNNTYYSGDSNEFGTHSVATKQPNELGLYDMSGNVREWCNDKFYYYDGSPFNWPHYVIRGGSCSDSSSDCRVSCRYRNGDDGSLELGLRLAL